MRMTEFKKRHKRIDEYIDKSADFAQPILRHLRTLIHTAHPDIEETIKWGMPYFVHKGNVCSFAAFNQHVAFGFWKQKMITDSKKVFKEGAMGSFGRITTLQDLPSDEIIVSYIQEAVHLNEK